MLRSQHDGPAPPLVEATCCSGDRCYRGGRRPRLFPPQKAAAWTWRSGTKNISKTASDSKWDSWESQNLPRPLKALCGCLRSDVASRGVWRSRDWLQPLPKRDFQVSKCHRQGLCRRPLQLSLAEGFQLGWEPSRGVLPLPCLSLTELWILNLIWFLLRIENPIQNQGVSAAGQRGKISEASA